MSYSIDEGLDDAVRYVETCKQIKERFPDARLDGDVWITALIKPEECDYLALRGTEPQTLHVGTLIGGRLVARRFDLTVMTPFILLYELKAKAPELYAKLVRFAAGGGEG